MNLYLNRKLKVNPEYEKLVPPLSDDEYKSLSDAIKNCGQQVPISYNTDYEILDGMTRFRICQSLDMAPKLEDKPKRFPDKLQEKLWVIDANLERRQLSNFAKIELRLRKKPIYEEIAKQNSLAGKPVTPSSMTVNQLIGKESGVSHETIRKVETLLNNSDSNEIEKLRSGKVIISRAFTNYKRSNDHKRPPKLPDGKFDVILADCPWRYDINLRDTAEQHYRTMDYQIIAQMKIPSADNCVLFLWATQPMIKEALYVMESWGFSYKSSAVWIKDRIGNGYYFRFRHELLLVGVKGTMPIPNESDRPDSVIEAPRRKHSEKPAAVYQIIERMYPSRKNLELFARSKYKR